MPGCKEVSQLTSRPASACGGNRCVRPRGVRQHRQALWSHFRITLPQDFPVVHETCVLDFSLLRTRAIHMLSLPSRAYDWITYDGCLLLMPFPRSTSRHPRAKPRHVHGTCTVTGTRVRLDLIANRGTAAQLHSAVPLFVTHYHRHMFQGESDSTQQSH